MSATISQYETHAADGDQRNAPQPHPSIHQRSDERYHEGQQNAHNNQDSKDSRSLNVRAAAAVADEEREERRLDEAIRKPPTAAAKDQGHKPSRGAQIDEQIEREEIQSLEDKRRT